MESFVFPPFGSFQSFRGGLPPNRGGESTPKQPSWKQNKSSGLGPFPVGPPTPVSADYLDSCRRAQLKALLSQVSPGLTPRLRRANTKEVGVQVNPRADAAVQCSLGPRTLPAGRPLTPAAARARGRLALYSPLLNPRLFTLPEAAAHREEEAAAPAAPEEQKAEGGSDEQREGSAEPAEAAASSEAPREQSAAPGRRAAFQVRGAGRRAGSGG